MRSTLIALSLLATAGCATPGSDFDVGTAYMSGARIMSSRILPQDVLRPSVQSMQAQQHVQDVLNQQSAEAQGQLLLRQYRRGY